MTPEAQKNLSLWLEGPYDAATKEEILKQLQADPKGLEDAFYTHLSFGTGGLRGLMGVGTNRMNGYTVRATTQGLANYLKKIVQGPLSVCIGYDARHHSRFFAEETAKVLAGNAIRVFLFQDIRPTPLVSFACRNKKCSAAIMITASHNPSAYNGYKVYWSDGGQVVSPHDRGILEEVSCIQDPSQVQTASLLSDSRIEWLGEKMDQLYLDATSTLQIYPQDNQIFGENLQIVYTSLHGTGGTLVPKILHRWGFSHVLPVSAQMTADGDFPTVASPNPEEPAALAMGKQLLVEQQADLLLATDPDADRVAAMVLHRGEPVTLTGNQLAALCLQHICSGLASQGRLPLRAAFVKSIGTTELFTAICAHFQRPCHNVLTGFKYIAEKIRQWEEAPNGLQYLFGGEESLGYLMGSLVRDKDGVSSSALICEAALQAKKQGKTLVDCLEDLFYTYGVYQESLLSLHFGETKAGKEQMQQAMSRLRKHIPKTIEGLRVICLEDCLSSQKKDLLSRRSSPSLLPISDVLLFWLEDKSKILIRPSGTEPKVKIYCAAVKPVVGTLSATEEACTKHCQALAKAAQHLLGRFTN